MRHVIASSAPQVKNDILEAALSYARKGWPVFPAWWPADDSGGCACGNTSCSSPGKHPITQHGVKDATTNEFQIRSWWEEYPSANVAVATGCRFFVVDEDAYHGGSISREEHLSDLPPTATVSTGSGNGSTHRYYLIPDGVVVRNRTGLFPGIDIRGDGGYVIAPPSRHWSGGTYTWVDEDDFPGPVPAPQRLLDLTTHNIEPAPVAVAHECDVPVETRLELAARYLTDCPPAISGQRGHDTTFGIVTTLVRGFCLTSRSDVLALLHDWNQTCRPPWTQKDLTHKFFQALSKSTKPWHYKLVAPKPSRKKGPVPVPKLPADLLVEAFAELATAAPTGEDPPLDIADIAKIDDDLARQRAIKAFAKVEGSTIPVVQKKVQELRRETARASVSSSWRSKLIYEPSGDSIVVKSCLANVVTLLLHHEALKGKVRFNTFTLEIENAGLPIDVPPGRWTDTATNRLNNWLQVNENIFVRSSIVNEAIDVASIETQYHPVRDYLDSLKWDGIERANSWLSDYCEAENSALNIAIGRKFLVSAVRRIYEPGAQADYTLILESPQGRKKSTLLRTLFGKDWFTDEVDALGSKDSAMQLRGVWGVELAELASVNRSDAHSTKAFLTRRDDRFRPPYGKHVISVPRQCVFIGTTNKDTYLIDDTGNRRFWTVRCDHLYPDDLAKVRDQLWAEAVHIYRAGEQPFLDDSLSEEIEQAQMQREVASADPWLEQVSRAIEAWPPSEPLNCPAIMDRLFLDTVHRTQAAMTRIGHIMRVLGYERKLVRTKGVIRRQYVKI